MFIYGDILLQRGRTDHRPHDVLHVSVCKSTHSITSNCRPWIIHAIDLPRIHYEISTFRTAHASLCISICTSIHRLRRLARCRLGSDIPSEGIVFRAAFERFHISCTSTRVVLRCDRYHDVFILRRSATASVYAFSEQCEITAS